MLWERKPLFFTNENNRQVIRVNWNITCRLPITMKYDFRLSLSTWINDPNINVVTKRMTWNCIKPAADPFKPDNMVINKTWRHGSSKQAITRKMHLFSNKVQCPRLYLWARLISASMKHDSTAQCKYIPTVSIWCSCILFRKKLEQIYQIYVQRKFTASLLYLTLERSRVLTPETAMTVILTAAHFFSLNSCW